MKNKLYKVIYFFCVSVLVLVYTFNAYSINSWADVPSGQIVVGNNGTWSGLPFTFVTNGKYYTVQDPTGIPTSTYLAPNYFYTTDNEKFFVVDGLKTFTAVLNKLVGVIYEPNELNNLFTGFQNAINGTDTVNNKYIRNCLYDSNDNFLGYCLNDITGCYYGGNPPTGSNVKDDGNYTNNVRNYYDYQSSNSAPDWFTYYPISSNYIINNYSSNLTQTQISYFNEKVQDFELCDYGGRNYSTSKTILGLGNPFNEVYNKFKATVDHVNFGVCKGNLTNQENWGMFSSIVNNNELLATEWITTDPLLSNSVCEFDAYNDNGDAIEQYIEVDISNMVMNVVNSNFTFFLGRMRSFGSHILPFNQDSVTLYKNSSIKGQFDSQTYTPISYTTDSFNNYDSNNDNSVDIPITQINQSISSNSSIYDSSSENFYNYYDNGYYDQSSATTNITNITNNYYGSSSDNPDNPDDPDEPSDVLSQILQALLRFFNAIGAVLGTILTGILTVVSEVLEAIASITVSLTSITDFFGAIFSWIPEPVPQILGLGFSICILCGIIKFIRG